VVFIVISLGSLPCDGENVVLTDDFAAGIQGWNYVVEPGAVMTWDSAEGNPDPGSAVLSTVEQSAQLEGYWVLGPCMETAPGERWRARSMVKKTGNIFGHCEVFISLFETPNCMGEGTATGSAIGVPSIEPDVWHSRVRGIDAYPATPSARPVLFMSVSPGTAISCHFDSVVVTIDRGAAALEVPTLSAVGLLIMASVLVALAVAVLARRRVERARPRR
jgi:hypothetical protein